MKTAVRGLLICLFVALCVFSWTFFGYAKIEIRKEYYSDGKLKKSKQYQNDKLKFEYYFKDDKKDGISKEYYESGKLKVEVNYKDDKKDGTYKSYFENGKLRQVGNYKDGKLEGIFKAFFENGEIQQESNYKDGKLDGMTKTYYESGRVKQVLNCKDGGYEGIQKVYYESGKLKAEGNFEGDKHEGVTKTYYESGKVQQEENYKDDNLNGMTKTYYESGKVKEGANWEDNKLLSIIYYDEQGKILPSSVLSQKETTQDKLNSGCEIIARIKDSNNKEEEFSIAIKSNIEKYFGFGDKLYNVCIIVNAVGETENGYLYCKAGDEVELFVWLPYLELRRFNQLQLDDEMFLKYHFNCSTFFAAAQKLPFQDQVELPKAELVVIKRDFKKIPVNYLSINTLQQKGPQGMWGTGKSALPTGSDSWQKPWK